jgi:serine protease inhibitor
LLCVTSAAAEAENAGAAAMKSTSIEVREQFLLDHPFYFEVAAALS